MAEAIPITGKIHWDGIRSKAEQEKGGSSFGRICPEVKPVQEIVAPEGFLLFVGKAVSWHKNLLAGMLNSG